MRFSSRPHRFCSLSLAALIAACSSGGVVLTDTSPTDDGGTTPTIPHVDGGTTPPTTGDAALPPVTTPPCLGSTCPVLLWSGLTDQTSIGGTALAVGENALYFPNSWWDNGAQVYDASLLSIPIAGGAATPVLASGDNLDLTHEVGLPLLDATTLYWTDVAGGVDSMPAGGGTVSTLITSNGSTEPVFVGLAVAGGFLYGSTGWDDNSLLRLPVGGGPATTLATLPSTDPIGGGIVLDATNVYWEAITRLEGQGAIGCQGGCISAAYTMQVLSMPIAGGTVTTLATTGMNDTQYSTLSMAVDADHVYFVDGGSLVYVPIAGGAEVTLASTPQVSSGFAYGGDSFYWAATAGGDGSTGTIAKASKSGAVSTFFSIEDATMVSVAVDASNVYAFYSLWGEATDENPDAMGAILKIAR